MTEFDTRGMSQREILLRLATGARQQHREKMGSHGWRDGINDSLERVAAVLEAAAALVPDDTADSIHPERLGHRFREWACVYCGAPESWLVDQRCPKRTR